MDRLESRPQSFNKNHELLVNLGLQKIRSPNTHHRKRLAVESRHHIRPDDSHMFIIKLPPNPHYYAFNQPDRVLPDAKKIPVGFKSNGKPGKIYHWNIPVIKQYVAHKQKSRTNDVDLDNPETWNEVLDKPVNPHKKPLKPSYYVPQKPKKSSFTKYFPGNGKPSSLYVIQKNKRAHYHRLLP
ncbi:uncharacterized protein LOC132699885 isoform X2 [Cylas formicarius]|nr:uncharacterized protein LOC132699885 isoform X2 [Cylas formicarius]XP_060522830.1 uncharacterized protein LOC132699885 isoform X2 [Cylas formicarius]XP_060522831.1 uncharacterized protein LOC132699885 isoform X2 [Cylas formicarius]XP_060522832.1 uncharacterized protein LOC132699885 isoform X2 [Cylas formicarius]